MKKLYGSIPYCIGCGMIVCFGEVMARFMPKGHLRLRQVTPGSLDVTFAGAESNVAAAIAILGGEARYVTSLPDHVMGHTCVEYFRGLGVDISQVAYRQNSRLGIFYAENGVSMRGGNVVYDREHSAFSETPPDAYRWDDVLKDCNFFFTTGISPAVSEQACVTTKVAIEAAKKHGALVAFDPNYRRTLWKWSKTTESGQLAKETLSSFLHDVDILFTNGDQAADLFDVPAPGEQTAESCLATARSLIKLYPQLRYIALTMREIHSSHDHTWGAGLYEASSDRLWFSPNTEGRYTPYRITQIVDRIGTGDAFAGGVLYALSLPEYRDDPQKVIDFATANGALGHTIMGDVNYIGRAEVESLMAGNRSGRIVR